jgi:MFS family permease
VIAVTIAVGFGAAALARSGPAWVLVAVLVPAAALAISWNGLVFTAAGELAPPGRAATAMALSNTANYVAAAVTPALGGWPAERWGWSAMLALGVVTGLAALAALYRLSERPTTHAAQEVPRRTRAGSQGTVVAGH